jgi:hypothetical protein
MGFTQDGQGLAAVLLALAERKRLKVFARPCALPRVHSLAASR